MGEKREEGRAILNSPFSRFVFLSLISEGGRDAAPNFLFCASGTF